MAASPEPQRIVEQRAITDLLAAGTVVICRGGGGAAVTADADGHLTGAEAVVDKDYVAALLAVAVHADRLLVLTDVSAVMRDFGTPQATPLAHLDLEQLATIAFPPGSMQPKIEACRRFVAATGHPANIGALTDTAALLAGTTITRRDRAVATHRQPAPVPPIRRSPRHDPPLDTSRPAGDDDQPRLQLKPHAPPSGFVRRLRLPCPVVVTWPAWLLTPTHASGGHTPSSLS